MDVEQFNASEAWLETTDWDRCKGDEFVRQNIFVVDVKGDVGEIWITDVEGKGLKSIARKGIGQRGC